MKIYKSLEEFYSKGNSIVTIGTFDGVHVGHQKILNSLKEMAIKYDGETVLLTFYPHPRLIINPDDQHLKLLSDIEEKVGALADAGVDHLIIMPFTRDFSNQSPEEYIRNVLIRKLGVRCIVIGYDHRFGKDRKGSIRDLRQQGKIYGFDVKEISEQDVEEVAVSSTKIREALIVGDIETANKYLGYPFELTGKVIEGDKIGRDLGFPTANLEVHEKHKLIPAYGIYAVEAQVFDGLSPIESGEYESPEIIEKFQAMAYIGNRPTVDGVHRTIEVNFLDFSGNLYNKTLRIRFLDFIRHDERFESMEILIKKMKEDEKKIRAFFENKNTASSF
ncbi:MAG TPA: bifunctional riboflavin kinase/FAD synthetase [Sphingobacterium sp.]|nr:bifunctional riboflavin kinase/FAD synthetase [Sphingobacterium sp.]